MQTGGPDGPSSILRRPSNREFLDIKSKAPTPSTVTTVALASWSVRACTMCATHSQPAFVKITHWKGVVATSALLANCFAMVLAANNDPSRLRGAFANAVNRPKRMPSITSSGHQRLPTGMQPAPTTANRPRSREWRTDDLLSCQTELGAAPLLAVLKHVNAKSLGSIRVWPLVGVGLGLSVPSKWSTFLAPHWRLPKPAGAADAPHCALGPRASGFHHPASLPTAVSGR